MKFNNDNRIIASISHAPENKLLIKILEKRTMSLSIFGVGKAKLHDLNENSKRIFFLSNEIHTPSKAFDGPRN